VQRFGRACRFRDPFQFGRSQARFDRLQNGEPTDEQAGIRLAVRPLRELYGSTPTDIEGTRLHQLTQPYTMGPCPM